MRDKVSDQTKVAQSCPRPAGGVVLMTGISFLPWKSITLVTEKIAVDGILRNRRSTENFSPLERWLDGRVRLRN